MDQYQQYHSKIHERRFPLTKSSIRYQIKSRIDQWQIYNHYCLPCIICSARSDSLVFHDCPASNSSLIVKIPDEVQYAYYFLLSQLCDYHHFSSYSNEKPVIHSILYEKTFFNKGLLYYAIWKECWNSKNENTNWVYYIPEEVLEDIFAHFIMK
jgi:hypothetical protein